MDEFDRWQQDSPFAPPAAQNQAPANAFDVLGVLNRRKWWILLFIAVGLLVGFIYNLASAPVYFSQARLTIARRAMLDNRQSAGADPRVTVFIMKEELETFALTLGSAKTAYAAILEDKLDQLPSFKGLPMDKVLQAVVEGVSVSRGDQKYEDANVINLGFSGPNSKDCQRVIQAMIRVFRNELQGSYSKTTQEIRDIYQKIRTDTEARLVNLKNQYRQLQRESPYLVDNFSSNAAIDARRQLDEAEKTLMELDNRYRTAVQRLNGGFSREVVLNWLVGEDRHRSDWLLLGPPEVAQRMMSLEQRIVDLVVQEKEAARKFGNNHPRLLQIRDQIAEVKRAYAEQMPQDVANAGSAVAAQKVSLGRQIAEPVLKESLSYDALYDDGLVGGSFLETRHFDMRLVGKANQTPQEENPQSDILDRRLQATRLAVEAATLRRDLLAQKAQAEEAKAKQIQTAQTEMRFLAQEIDEQQKRLDIAVERLRQIEVAPRDGYLVNTIKEPGWGMQIGPSLPLNLVLGGFAFGLLGFGVAFLIDRADQTFRSPEEIRRALGVQVVGHIPVYFPLEDDELDPQLPPPSPSIDRMICTYSNPDSVAAEAFRAVRTNLYFSTHGESHKVIQVTGPTSEDGKSTLAANLAVGLAQSGVKVLLMDADFRRPRVHQNFGVDKEAGLSSLIRGQIELSDAVHSIPDIENLDVMPSGPRPRNPSELLTLPKFKELLATLRDRYDFVIVDSPPILAVTDPGAIAAQVDGVLLALQIRRRSKPSAIRAVEILSELGANVIGVVVNGVGWKRAFSYRDGGNFGAGSKFYRYSVDFRGAYSLGEAYAYGPATIGKDQANGELLDADAVDRAEAQTP